MADIKAAWTFFRGGGLDLVNLTFQGPRIRLLVKYAALSKLTKFHNLNAICYFDKWYGMMGRAQDLKKKNVQPSHAVRGSAFSFIYQES